MDAAPRLDGETDTAALVREIREELAVRLRPDTLVLEGAFTAQADGKPEGTLVRVTCYRGRADGIVTPLACWLR